MTLKTSPWLSFAIQDSGRGESSGATRNKLPICPEWTFSRPFLRGHHFTCQERPGSSLVLLLLSVPFFFFIGGRVALSLFFIYVDFRVNVNVIVA